MPVRQARGLRARDPAVGRGHVDLARAEQRELRRAVADEDPLDAVEMRQPGAVVVGVPREDRLDAGLMALEHEGPAAHQRGRRAQVARRRSSTSGGRIASDGSARLATNGANGSARRTRTVCGSGASIACTGPRSGGARRATERALERVAARRRRSARGRAAARGPPSGRRGGAPARTSARPRCASARSASSGTGAAAAPARSGRRGAEEAAAHERRDHLRLRRAGGLDVEGRRVSADVLEHAAAPRPPRAPPARAAPAPRAAHAAGATPSAAAAPPRAISSRRVTASRRAARPRQSRWSPSGAAAFSDVRRQAPRQRSRTDTAA